MRCGDRNGWAGLADWATEVLRILLDNCVHKAVRHFFPGHEVKTAFEAGTARLGNGELLREAAKSFDILVTTDKNMRYQHRLETLEITILELAVSDMRLESLQQLQPNCDEAVGLAERFRFVSLKHDGTIETAAPKAPSA